MTDSGSSNEGHSSAVNFYCFQNYYYYVAFGAWTLLVGQQKGIRPVKIWGWWRRALVTSLDGVAPIWMVSVSASVNLPLHHEVQKFSSGTDSPGWSRKKGRKTVVVSELLHLIGACK